MWKTFYKITRRRGALTAKRRAAKVNLVVKAAVVKSSFEPIRKPLNRAGRINCLIPARCAKTTLILELVLLEQEKTFLAVACAVEALEAQSVSRILLVRPAVEAGEKLGFLPGDLAQKIDPYLRPLYDALYEMMGIERVTKFIERNIIEVAPLAYMRGPHAE